MKRLRRDLDDVKLRKQASSGGAVCRKRGQCSCQAVCRKRQALELRSVLLLLFLSLLLSQGDGSVLLLLFLGPFLSHPKLRKTSTRNLILAAPSLWFSGASSLVHSRFEPRNLSSALCIF
ncbi:hypothetical protein YC2023_031725 [Brassica napus]